MTESVCPKIFPAISWLASCLQSFLDGCLLANKAIPIVAKIYTVDIAVMNNIISIFLVGCALGQEIDGPISDQIGRKKLRIGGLVLFITTFYCHSICCYRKSDIVFRLLQSISAGVATVICMPFIRDVYGAKVSR